MNHTLRHIPKVLDSDLVTGGGVTEEHGCVILMKPVRNLLLTYLLCLNVAIRGLTVS